MAFEPKIVRPEEDGAGGKPGAAGNLDAKEHRAARARRRLDRIQGTAAGAPKIFHDERAQESGGSRTVDRDEFSLTDDLAELARQLSADAAHLERLYPASPPTVSGETPGTWLLRIGAAAMLVVCSVWWGAHRRQSLDEQQTLGDASRGAGQPSQIVGSGSVANRSMIGVSSAAAFSGNTAISASAGAALTPVAAPAAWLNELSSPEREGALDLLEQQAAPLASLSI